MDKILSIRKNDQLYSLFVKIQEHQKSANRTDIVNSAIQKALEEREKGILNWNAIASGKTQSVYIDSNEFPEFIQLRVDEDKYRDIVEQMKKDFNLEKRSPASFVVKLLLINYLQFLESQDVEMTKEDFDISKEKRMNEFKELCLENKLDAIYELLLDKNIDNPFIQTTPAVSNQIKIGSLNFDSYMAGDMGKKITAFEEMKNTFDIWALQDFKPGKSCSNAKDIAGDLFTYVCPNTYEEENSEFSVNLLLLKKSTVHSFEPLSFGNEKFFSLRYIYGRVTTSTGRIFRLLNIYIPHSIGITDKRKKEIKELWERLLEEAKNMKSSPEEFIVLGDFNADTEEKYENSRYFKALSDTLCEVGIKDKKDGHYFTWESKLDRQDRGRLDHIFCNRKVSQSDYMVSRSPIEKEISDHKYIGVNY